MLDRPGVDTELARLLHRTERVDLAALQGSLEEARRARGGAGPTLAQVLVQRGLVSQAEVASLLGHLQAGPRPTGSLPAVPGGPRPTGSLPAVRPAGTRPDLPAVSGPPTGTEVHRWAAGSAEQSYAAGPPVRSTGRHVARPSGSWDVRPAERSEAGRGFEPERLEAWRPGGRVGDYVLDRQAGAGAMGVVFIGRHAHTGGQYAIKTLRNGEDPTLLERFRREGEAQARVDGHVNVARVHTMGEAHGRLYIVMELVEGGNLDDRIKRGTPPWPEAARMVAGVARGLAHMHARGVLHRDLKPSNVLFDAEGTPKLVDFGLAKSAGADRLTLTGEVVGTPSYMAPEQALGHRDQIGPWTDAWALGGVLFYVLTGRPPFDGTTSMQVITRVAEEEAPSARSVRTDVPQELDALCRALMRRPIGERLTPAQAAERLEAFAAAATAQPDAPPPRASRGLVALAGLAAASVVAGVAALALAGPRKSDDPPPPGGDGRAPTAAVTEAPAVAGPPAPASPPAPWTVGQERRCRVGVAIEGEFPEWMQRMQLTLSERLDMRWKVTGVEAGRVQVEAVVDAFTYASLLKAAGSADTRWSVDFDSGRDAGSSAPFHAVVGGALKLTLDARTGQVLELQGAGALQEAVFQRARAADPALREDEGKEQGEDSGRERRGGGRFGALMQYRVPLFADPEGLRETLNGALHALPAEPADRRDWTLPRAPEVAGPYWPGGLSVEVEVTRSDDELRWTGSRRATFRPPWLEGAQGTIRRLVQGRAALTPARDRVVSGSFKETWRSEVEGRDAITTSATYEVEVEVTDLP